MIGVPCVDTPPFVYVGVTVIVAVIGAVPVLVGVKLGIVDPDPLAPNPIDGVLFVQLYVVPDTNDPPKLTADVKLPLQTTTSVGFVTVAVGYTDIVKLVGVPIHPSKIGVTNIVLVIVVLVLFVATKLPMFPVPLPDKPIEVLLFVHE